MFIQGEESHTSRTACVKCAAGKYQPIVGGACLECEKGTYSSEEGQETCTECSLVSGLYGIIFRGNKIGKLFLIPKQKTQSLVTGSTEIIGARKKFIVNTNGAEFRLKNYV